ncbi:MAG: hypothetical protein GX847_04010, partial [Clostridiales bacterium]|nr:hypothetical protein [Clostridiales bacterium]
MRFIRQLKKMTPLSGTSLTMSRRLFFYTFTLFLLIGTILAGCIMLSGRFQVVERSTASMLETQLSVYEQNIRIHFDHTAALGLNMSADLSIQLEEWLEQEGFEFEDLNGNPDAIAQLELFLYSTLHQSIALTDCSGVYFLLDVTANPDLPGADRSKSGLYLKIANLNVVHPINMKLLQYRGSTAVGNNNGLEYHNMWALEYNADDFPNYDLVMSHANADLNSCYLFTDSMKLPGTWEKAMLLCVPIVSDSGDIYGICGFEISQLFYKLYYAHASANSRLSGILTMAGEDGLRADSGLESGTLLGYFANLTGTLSISNGPGFQIFDSGEHQLAGLKKSIKLSPVRGEHTLAVMIPKADYEALRMRNIQENAVIIILIIFVTALGSIQMSRLYVKPILAGLSQVRSQGTCDITNIREIDDLLEYLSQKDAEMEAAAAAENRQQQKTVTLYEEFVKNIETHSPA